MEVLKLPDTSFDKPKPTNLTGNPNEKSEFTLYSNRSKEDLPQNGVRFKAAVSGNNSKNDNEVPSFDSTFKADYPKNSMIAEIARRENEGNEQKTQNISLAPYSLDNVSSTLDKYEPLDALKDLTVPSLDFIDIIDDIKNKDYISAYYDYTKIWTAMDGEKLDLFNISLGSVANDAGTITSKLDAINPYKVDIYFTIRR